MVGSENWAYIQTPKIIFDEIQNILKDTEYQKLGFFKPKDIALVLFREFIKNPKTILKMEKKIESEITLIRIIDDKIILNDSQLGAVIIEIDEKNRLMCYNCKDDPHNNKYVDFVSEKKDLWDFLKKRNVKFVKIRDNNH